MQKGNTRVILGLCWKKFETIGIIGYILGYILGLYCGYNGKENGNYGNYRVYIGVYIRIILGLYGNNGKENGNYREYIGVKRYYRVYIGVI